MKNPLFRRLLFLLAFVLPSIASAFYDPRIGRWLSRDPLGAIDGPNFYNYVLNRPTDRTDLLGLYIVYGQGSAEFWENYREAYKKTRLSEYGGKLLDYIEKSPKMVYIEGAKQWEVGIKANTFCMPDGNSHIRFDQGDFKNIFKFDSKWRTLPHELFHAAGHLASDGQKGWLLSPNVNPTGIPGVVLPNSTGRMLIEGSAVRAANIISIQAGDTNVLQNSYNGMSIPFPDGVPESYGK